MVFSASFLSAARAIKTKEANEVNTLKSEPGRWQTPQHQIALDATTLWVNREQGNTPASQGFYLHIDFFRWEADFRFVWFLLF